MLPKRLLTLLCLFVAISCSKQDLKDTQVPPPPPPPTPVAKVPKLTTDSISGLTVYSVTLGGRIVDTGGSKVIEQGIIVGLKTGATISDNFNKFKIQADSNGHFETNVIEVPTNTTFYIKAYGINAEGAGYGNEVVFLSPKGNVSTYDTPTQLTTQDEVNAFGAHNYTQLINGLEITGNSITDLSPLKSIVIVGGSLRIMNTSLQNLRGFDSLEIIGNVFFNTTMIYDNPLLKDLTGLNNVKLIRGAVEIARNSSLINLQGLNNVKLLHGSSLGVYNCNGLINLDGLEKLEVIDGPITLNGNTGLSDVKALKSLIRVTGDVRILDNPQLTTLTGFDKVKDLQILELTRNATLKDLSGLKNLETLQGLQIDGNEQLSDLNAFSEIRTMEYLDIQRSDLLVNLHGFTSLESVTKKLTISFNPNLVDFTGLEKVKNGGAIEVSFNNSLVNLKGLEGLQTLSGPNYSLTVSQNPSLVSLTGLENLTVANGIYIENNSPQLNYCALKPFALNYAGSEFFLSSNSVAVSKADLIATCP